MKKVLSALVISMVSASALASNALDGREFCRIVIPDVIVGQAPSQKHCITLSNGVAVDNSSTFFGNPPEYAAYTVKGRILTFAESKYVLAKDLSDIVTISGSAAEGTVLTAQ